MRDEYEIHVEASDLWVALECEADRAKREGFPLVEARQRKAALHLRNAERHMRKLGLGPAFRVQTTIRLEVVPNVNPALKPEYWKD